ncbi:MAG: hypothetical protein AB7P17_08975 [Nitrospirales bacterium]|nr:hypothetical protein [Nitrospirales bacterium]
MWRHLSLMFLLVLAVGVSGCSFDNTPKRMMAYLDPSPSQAQPDAQQSAMPTNEVKAAMVVLNDAGFEKSAPELRKGTLQHLGEQLKVEIEKQLPLQLTSVLYPDDVVPQGSSDMFIKIAKKQEVPFLLVAVLSSSEVEVFDRLPMQGMQQGGGMRGSGMPGYRAENYARMELALLDGQTGHPVMTTDGQAWATLERLVVPMESNVYPVVRRDLTQPPIYPNSEEDAYETLRWVSGQDAIAQAVMHLEQLWKKNQAA